MIRSTIAGGNGIDGLTMAETGAVATIPDLEKTSEESLLLDRLFSIEDNRVGAYSIHIRLSELRQVNRKPHYIRIATRSFDQVIAGFNATLFELSNCDLVLLCVDVAVDEIDPAIAKVRALFSEDPLTAAEEGSIEDVFATWYDLSQDEDYNNFVSLITDLAADAEERLRKMAEEKALEGARQMSGTPLSPGNLVDINKKMSETRISDLIQQQSAIKIEANGTGKVLFCEHFVTMAGLQKRVAPDINLFGSTWLFQYLTETLDRRVLAVIGRRDFAAMETAISLNLNISIVLSKEFQLFHHNVGDNAHKVVIEMHMVDICADMESFTYARNMLQERGYRVLIDGVNPLSLQYFDPSALDADFVKVGWGKEFFSEVPGAHTLGIQEIVNRTGKNRIILARIDNEKAVEWALSFGITRFQGHYIDKIVEAMRAKGIIRQSG